MHQPGPYHIEYSHLLTDKSLAEHINAIRAPNREKKNKAGPILEKNKDILIAEYHKVEQRAIQEFKDRHNELRLQKNAFDKKECEHCQRPLKFIRNDYQDYYVCPEFRDGNQHSKFYVDLEERIQARLPGIKIRIEMDWLTNILKATALRDQIRASDLFKFLEEHGFDDLRAKYGLSGTKRLITSLTRAKQASTQEEREIAAFLRPFFSKCAQQQGIRYKLQGEKDNIAILDLIVSDDKTVYLLEIKREPLYISEHQLTFYQALLQHIMEKAGDRRRIHPVFLVYNTPEYPVPYLAGTYVLYEEIKTLGNAAAIISKFENMAHRKSYEYRIINPSDYYR